jgi:hypothetical protein
MQSFHLLQYALAKGPSFDRMFVYLQISRLFIDPAGTVLQ